MGRRAVGKAPGTRFTKPKSKVRDARCRELYSPDFVAQVREHSADHCLDLGGLQHREPPQALTKLEYQFDAPELTGFAGIPAFMKFAYGLGLADRVADLPLVKRDSIYSPGKLCEVMVALLAAGLERVSHVDDHNHDIGLCDSLGLERLPDQATLSRFFGDVGASAVAFMRRGNQEFSRQINEEVASRRTRLVVDGDTRIVGVYGKQEGAKRSPRNNGKPQFTFEITTLRNTYDILDGGLLEGATHPAPLFESRFETVLGQLSSKTNELVWCGDAAWYAAHILLKIEAADEDENVPCSCKYAIRAQMRDGLLERVKTLPEDAWRPCEADMEIAEVEFAFRDTRRCKDRRVRRYIVTRQGLPDKAVENGQGVLVPRPRYEYWAIVTTLDWKPRQVWDFYNHRVTVESILKESALGFHMDSLPSGKFVGNELFCQLLILAYNHVNLFRRLCLPAEHCRRHVQGLRRVVLAVPGWIESRAESFIVHCAPGGPPAKLLPGIMEALHYGLAPVEHSLTAAAIP